MLSIWPQRSTLWKPTGGQVSGSDARADGPRPKAERDGVFKIVN
jgi:hypothetical protein